MERKLLFLAAIFLTIIIGWGSLVSLSNTIPKTVSISDKIIHATAYFLLTLSWLVVFKNSIKKLKMNSLISMFVFLYGTIIEVLQGSLTTYRQFELKDLAANLIGIVIAFTMFNFFLQKKVFK